MQHVTAGPECMLLAETIFVILPFLMSFHKEWRFSAGKIAGILAGYLFFVYFISFLLLRGITADIYFFCNFTATTLSVLVCRRMVKTDWLVTIYSLFLYKNFADLSIFFSGLFHLSGVFFLCLVMSCAFRLLHRHLADAVEYTRPLPVWRYLVAIPILFYIVHHFNMMYLLSEKFTESRASAFFSAVCWLACISTVHYVSLRILSRLAQSYAVSEEYRTSRLLAGVQASQMAAHQYNLDQLKKARHDYRHHLITVKGLLDEHESAKALEYIDEYLGDFETLSTVRYCGNSFANSILNYYIQLAENQGIRVKTSISLSESLPLPDTDFCTILGNLLSNAVESCLRQTRGVPSITVSIGEAGASMIAISVKNTYSHEIRMKNGCFLSSKREGQGTGTASVRYLAQQYHGILKFTYENGIFEASLLLNPKMK